MSDDDDEAQQLALYLVKRYGEFARERSAAVVLSHQQRGDAEGLILWQAVHRHLACLLDGIVS